MIISTNFDTIGHDFQAFLQILFSLDIQNPNKKKYEHQVLPIKISTFNFNTVLHKKNVHTIRTLNLIMKYLKKSETTGRSLSDVQQTCTTNQHNVENRLVPNRDGRTFNTCLKTSALVKKYSNRKP